MKVLKNRAEKQVDYRRETILGVVVDTEEEEGLYQVRIAGYTNPIRGVYNAAGLHLNPGDGVTMNRVGGSRFVYQIVSRATVQPVDLQAHHSIARWDQFKWDDGSVWR